MNEEIVTGRANALVDPTMHIWGWEIPVYLFLGGLAAGLLVISAAMRLRHQASGPRSGALQAAPFLALGILSLGMIALFLDLEHKTYVWRFYLAFRPASPMSWGSWILILVYPAGFLLGLGSLSEEARLAILRSRPVQWLRLSAPLMCAWGRADRYARVVAWAALGVGASLGIYTGILLGALAAEPLWNTPILGPLFLASGLSSGAALLLILPVNEKERHDLVRWDISFISFEIVLIAFLLIGFASGGSLQQEALRYLTAGPHASAFWTLVVLAGLVIPLILEVLEHRRHLPTLLAAPALVLVGGFALRWILVVAGQETSLATIY